MTSGALQHDTVAGLLSSCRNSDRTKFSSHCEKFQVVLRFNLVGKLSLKNLLQIASILYFASTHSRTNPFDVPIILADVNV